MKDLTELQQEFENLIVELDKLKSINQLVSTNEENARIVVDKISDITNAVFNFREIVETDFTNKALIINELIDNLSLLKDETKSDLILFKNKFSVDNQKISDSINSVNRKVEEERAIMNKIQNISNELYISFNDIKIADRLFALYSLTESYKDEFVTILTYIKLYEKSFSNKISNIEDSSNSNFSNLQSQIQHLKDKIKSNSKMQKNYSLITWILLLLAILLPFMIHLFGNF